MKRFYKKLPLVLLVTVAVVCLTVSLVACDPNDNKTVLTQLSAPKISISEDGVISWDAVEHATGYIVNQDGTKVAEVTASPYTITQTTPGTYSYTVIAVGDGKEYDNSPASDAKSYTVDQPTLPQLAKPVVELSGNVLGWAAVEHATGYEVYEGTTKVYTGTELSYTIPSKDTGSYDYTVVAIGDGKEYGNSPASDKVTFTVAKLATPTGFQLDSNYQPNPRITWTAVEGASGYRVTLTVNGVEGEPQIIDSASCALSGYGVYGISVVALAGDAPQYKDSDPGTFSCTYANPESTQLDAPQVSLAADGYTLTWAAVDNATEYRVMVGSNIEAVVDADDSTDGGYSYEANSAKLGDDQTEISYVIVAVGDGVNYSDSNASGAVAVSRYGSPYLSINGNILSWTAVNDIRLSALLASQYEIYCDGELVATVDGNNVAGEDMFYTIEGNESGFYRYYVVAVDKNGKHLPSLRSNIIGYNELEPLGLGNTVKFGMGQYDSIVIYLDESVTLKVWYDFELKVVGSSLDDLTKLSSFPINFWGCETVDDSESGGDLWKPVYMNGVQASDNVYNISIIPLEEGLVKITIAYTENFNADYVLFELSMKANTDKELPDKLPGDSDDDGELSVEGTLGVSVNNGFEDVGSAVEVHYLKGFDYAALPIDTTGSTDNPLVAGKTYKLRLNPIWGSGYTMTETSQMAYAFSEAAFDDDTYIVMTNTFGWWFECTFTLPESVDVIYILNLDENVTAHFTARIFEVVEDVGGDDGGDQNDTLGIGSPVTVDIPMGGVEIDLQQGLSGTYTITLSGDGLDFLFGASINVTVGDSSDSVSLSENNGFSAQITIPEGAATIKLSIENNMCSDVTVTLSDGEGDVGGDNKNTLDVGNPVTVDINDTYVPFAVELASDVSGSYVVTLSGDALATLSEFAYFAITLDEDTPPDDGTVLNAENNYSATIVIPQGVTEIYIFGLNGKAVVTITITEA